MARSVRWIASAIPRTPSAIPPVKTILLPLVTVLLLAPQDPKTYSLVYKNGETVNAQVVEVKGEDVKLKVLVMGGSMVVRRKLAEFMPSSAFVIDMEAKDPHDFDSHFAMAKRAAELGLVPQAGAQARAAIESVKDPAQAESKRTEVRKWAADALEKMLRDSVAAGRLADAQHYLKLVSTRLADQRSEQQLDELAALVEGLDTSTSEKMQTERQAKMDAKQREAINSQLKPIQKQVEAGDKAEREAVAKSRTTVASTKLCEKAIDSYKAAWKSLQALVEKYQDDADLSHAAEKMGEHIHDQAIRAGLHAANMLTVQSDYKGALDWTARILAFDPDNAEAKEMMKTIQIAQAAASNQWGWGWNVVGGAPPPPKPKTKD
jgi:tetratricopeptide (TPR) repeat protein